MRQTGCEPVIILAKKVSQKKMSVLIIGIGARSISTVTQALEPLAVYGFEGGRDYEKVESARLLTPSEYTLNSTLGYISLRAELRADEVLAVAYEYTYNGQKLSYIPRCSRTCRRDFHPD